MDIALTISDDDADFCPTLTAEIQQELYVGSVKLTDNDLFNPDAVTATSTDFSMSDSAIEAEDDNADFLPLPASDELQILEPELDALEELELDLHSYISMNKLDYELTSATGPVIHMGFDSEYVAENNNGKLSNRVLSLQAYIRNGGRVFRHIHYPKGPKKTDRPTFSKFVSEVINGALNEGVIDEPPSVIFIYAHFIRADLPSFQDFFDFKREGDSIGGSFSSLMKPYGVDVDINNARRFKPEPITLKGEGRTRYRCLVRFIDTLPLAPGYAGLGVIGEMLGIPKVDIPHPFSIERMDEFLAKDPEGFEDYIQTDAEIPCEYGISLQMFAREQLKLNQLPATLGGCAVSGFLNSLSKFEGLNIDGLDYTSLFGVEYKQEEHWNDKTKRIQKRRVKSFTPASKFHRPFVIDCCAGGRNEGFFVGPTPLDKWVDVDLRGAYTRGLCDIHPIDYEGAYTSTDEKDYLGHVMGFAYVKFKFLDNTRFPCLPVDAGAQGRIFPLEGECYCGAPEIYLAHTLGCELEIQHGVIYPWKTTEVRIFQPFVQWVRDQRAYHKAHGDKFKEQLVKNIGNNCYGKTYQGLVQGKTGFDSKTGLSKKIGESAISSPPIAGHTTSVVRGVIGEMLSKIPDDRTVTNVTTDGFIVNMKLSEIDISGPLCQRYQGLCDLLYKGEHMLEEKHVVKQLIGMKTRGQITAIPYPGKEPVLAKAGYKPPVSKEQHNEHMIKEYLNRYPGMDYKFNSLISMRDQWITESDLVRYEQKRLVNFEYDFKRRPMQPYMQNVRDTQHLAFDTVPWRNLEEFRQVRAVFDGWRRKHCLKNMDDWEHWEDYLAVKQAYQPKCGIKFLDGERSDNLLKRVFLRAYGQGAYGLTKHMKQQELADWLTEKGYPTSIDDIKSGSRNRSSLPYQIIPVTKSVVKLIHVLKQQWPSLDISCLLQSGQAEKCILPDH